MRDAQRFFGKLTYRDIATVPEVKPDSAEASCLGPYTDEAIAYELVRDFFDLAKGLSAQRCLAALQLLRLCAKVGGDHSRRRWEGWSRWGEAVEHLQRIASPPAAYPVPVGAYVHPASRDQFGKEIVELYARAGFLKRGVNARAAAQTLTRFLTGNNDRMALDLERVIQEYAGFNFGETVTFSYYRGDNPPLSVTRARR